MNKIILKSNASTDTDTRAFTLFLPTYFTSIQAAKWQWRVTRICKTNQGHPVFTQCFLSQVQTTLEEALLVPAKTRVSRHFCCVSWHMAAPHIAVDLTAGGLTYRTLITNLLLSPSLLTVADSWVIRNGSEVTQWLIWSKDGHQWWMDKDFEGGNCGLFEIICNYRFRG
jgi:hypothetical protein